MAIRCPRCGREYDVTLFEFGRTVACECGNVVGLSGVRTLDQSGVPTRLVLVRHGETDWNADSRVQGHQPTLLNRRGRLQARLLADRLAREQPRNLYSSDLPRAMETAEVIAAKLGLTAVPAPELREMNFGQWEGRTFAEIEQDGPATFAAWISSDFRQAPPGGESADDLRERVIAFLARLLERHRHQTTALVTHGGPCKYVIAHTLGIGPAGVYRFAVDNASVHIIEIGPYGWRLTALNDTCHLDRLARREPHRAGSTADTDDT